MRILIIVFVTLVLLASCQKFLDEKPNKQLVTPTTLSSLQALLDNGDQMNMRAPSSNIAAADEYILPDAVYQSLPLFHQRMYAWDMQFPIVFENGNDWSFQYDVVYNCNVVLENMPVIHRTVSNAAAWDHVKGTALAYRAQAFTHLVWLYAKVYHAASANSEPGIALRTGSDFNVPSVRATLEESYQQILVDLHGALPLLPAQPVFPTRPSKASVHAWLARVHLSMGNYDSVYVYADQCLSMNHSLLDYATLDGNAQQPVAPLNQEIIWDAHVAVPIYYGVIPFYSRVDSTFVNSYAHNDLRRQIFFQDNPDGFSFKGTYGLVFFILFGGIATDEVYLMRAEAAARTGRVPEALDDLNTLLSKRYDATFIPVTATNPAAVLDIILAERHKELLFRGLRWMDIKRLNKEGANISLRRTIEGQEYMLPPNDPRFALPIPADVIDRSGMPQNKYD